MKKSTMLRNLINSDKLEFIMEAHNGLSAKIVEEAGFKGIWGSGLSLSASLGVRDNNEASWTQILEVIEFMSDASSIPILLDGDTGYGNFNNARRLTKKLEQRNIAGVCIEDKLFPKTNSFIGGETQPLADIDEFCGKLKAIKDTQIDEDFVLVARIEAFIAGWGLGEAIRRAEEYRKAGADAILVHSKKNDPSDIQAFMKEWANRHPVVIVPTKYYSTPTRLFEDLGINLVIWANHNLRASIDAMKKITKKIHDDRSLVNIEDGIVTVSEVFRLQGAEELKIAEKNYLPATGKEVNSIILAASKGTLGELTDDIPKTLLKINNKTILSTQINQFNKVGIKDITVVRGFAKEKVVESNVKMIDNDEYDETKELYSLYLAREEIKGNTVISFGDIIFRGYILNDLLNDANDINFIVDADYEIQNTNKYYVLNSEPYSKLLYDKNVRFIKMGSSDELDNINGEFIGLCKLSTKGSEIMLKVLNELSTRDNFRQMTLGDLFNEIAKTSPIAVKYIKGSWLDINTAMDFRKAGEF